jgi:hypothetical protein
VNPEKASKVKLRTPTHFALGEGRSVAAKQPTRAAAAVRRGSGSGTRGRFFGQRGRSAEARGSDPERGFRLRRKRKSERPIVPLKPGNAGGGKGPHFRVLWRERRRRD